jgi:hypothetical protein
LKELLSISPARVCNLASAICTLVKVCLLFVALWWLDSLCVCAGGNY